MNLSPIVFDAPGNISAPKIKSIGEGFPLFFDQILIFWKTSVNPQRDSFKHETRDQVVTESMWEPPLERNCETVSISS